MSQMTNSLLAKCWRYVRAFDRSIHYAAYQVVVPVVLLCCLAFPHQILAGHFGGESNIPFTDEDRAYFEKHNLILNFDGEERVLIGDLLYPMSDNEVLAFDGRQWPGGTFIYAFDPDVSENLTWMNAFRQACDTWAAQVPNIRCRERTTESNYVEVRTHSFDSCSSFSTWVGMQGGRQVISIHRGASGCPSHWFFQGVLVHEIGHALGLLHEQSRWDRPSYLAFLPENLTNPTDPRLLYQYRLVPNTLNTSYTPYDVNSIMHYSDRDNAKLGKVVLTASVCFEGVFSSIGSTGFITTDDALEMRHHYGLPIYDMLEQTRDPLCGSERLNRSERKHFCNDIGENCGPGAEEELYSALSTGHRTWWCPGAFNPVCPNNQSGPKRSCCAAPGKFPFEVYHRRGGKDCDLKTRRTHITTWNCGCPYFVVNARCASATFGFNEKIVQEYLSSRDQSLKTLGKFASTLIRFQEEGLLEADTLYQLEDELIKDFGIEHYIEGLDNSRRRLLILEHGGFITSSKPLAKFKLRDVIAREMRAAADCDASGHAIVNNR